MLASVLVAFGMTYAYAMPAMADSGAAKTAVCDGITQAGGDCAGDGAQVTKVIKLVIQIISAIAGIAAIIMVILSGMKYITSGGDSSKVASAKNSLIYAIIGLIIVALSQTIVHYVLGNVTK
jgi:hypothetical protein